MCTKGFELKKYHSWSSFCWRYCQTEQIKKKLHSFMKLVPLLHHTEVFKTNGNYIHTTHLDATHKYCTIHPENPVWKLKDNCNSVTPKRKTVSSIAEQNRNKTKAQVSRCTMFPHFLTTSSNRCFASHNVQYKTLFIWHLDTFSYCQCVQCAYDEMFLAMLCTIYIPRAEILPNASRCLCVCFVYFLFALSQHWYLCW